MYLWYTQPHRRAVRRNPVFMPLLRSLLRLRAVVSTNMSLLAELDVGLRILGLIFALFATGYAQAQQVPFAKAHSLATNICSQCHLFAEPSLLDKATWRDKVKPLMRSTMGLAAIENDPSPNSRILI